jgi:PIN domain nuclease of toxin-antitoxin system
MKVLLDTHILWWVLNSPAKLTPRVRDVIGDPTSIVLCSTVTAWELATKHRIGKFPEASPLLASFAEQLTRLGATELPVSTQHGLLAGRLEWEHRDPFDRMLAAQSILDGARLVTSDRAFSTLPGVDILW